MLTNIRKALGRFPKGRDEDSQTFRRRCDENDMTLAEFQQAQTRLSAAQLFGARPSSCESHAIRWLCRNGHLDELQSVVRKYRDACQIATTAAAIESACSTGNLAVLQWLHGDCRKYVNADAHAAYLQLNANTTYFSAQFAAAHGHTHILQWLVKTYQRDSEEPILSMNRFGSYRDALRQQQTITVHWLIEEAPKLTGVKPLHHSLLAALIPEAVKLPTTDWLAYLFEELAQHCRTDNSNGSRVFDDWAPGVMAAIVADQLPNLEFLYIQYCQAIRHLHNTPFQRPTFLTEAAFVAAAKAANLRVLDYCFRIRAEQVADDNLNFSTLNLNSGVVLEALLPETFRQHAADTTAARFQVLKYLLTDVNQFLEKDSVLPLFAGDTTLLQDMKKASKHEWLEFSLYASGQLGAIIWQPYAGDLFTPGQLKEYQDLSLFLDALQIPRLEQDAYLQSAICRKLVQTGLLQTPIVQMLETALKQTPKKVGHANRL